MQPPDLILESINLTCPTQITLLHASTARVVTHSAQSKAHGINCVSINLHQKSSAYTQRFYGFQFCCVAVIKNAR